ncbi:hypothetical protein [Sphingomonas dokdonensis]|uniref:hypothetical protein n=1 Tax=Sphingomonas dokdonensis TaxID=344880 RepID=UPI00117A6A2E|nr:hypothetical protein [Sphingomonas dokdonensis]
MKLTDYLAIYGAALSTLVFIWNATRSTPKIKVRLTFAVETIEGVAKAGLGISVQNPSSSAAHITNVSFVYPWRRVTWRDRISHLVRFKSLPVRIGWCHSSLSNFDLEDGCPVTIEPAQSHWIFVPSETVEKLFSDALKRKVVVQVQDALWRNKYSKAYNYPAKPQ